MMFKKSILLFALPLFYSFTNIEKLDPAMGFRFVITGDFDGDGRKEKLREYYVSRIDYKEIPKFDETAEEYDDVIGAAVKKKPLSYMLSDNLKVDTLFVSSSDYNFGVLFMKNEGDLDGDGGDEISFVVNAADYSSVNECSIMSYKKGKWKELYSFTMWEWLLPQLPGIAYDYGLMGITDQITIEKESINTLLEEQIYNFEGLIKKIGKNKIQIIHSNEEAELTTSIVDLKRKKILSSSF